MNSFMKIEEIDFMDYPTVEVHFLIQKVDDLAIRNGEFFAIWDGDEGCWKKDLYDVAEIIDKRIMQFVEEKKKRVNMNYNPIIKFCRDYNSGIIEKFIKYCSCMSDNYYQVYCV